MAPPFRFSQLIDPHPWFTYVVRMTEIEFAWDERKKHQQSQETRRLVRRGADGVSRCQCRVYLDPDHSDDEDRFILLGVSFQLRVLVVCHCHREDDDVIRIISARKADKLEEKDYWS